MKHYQRLEGMVAATFTPMDARGDINLSVIDKYADLMAESGMAGGFVCGTTGESHSVDKVCPETLQGDCACG